MIAVAAANDNLFAKLCGALGRPDLPVDARFATNADRVQSVVGEINELGGLVRQLAATVSTHEDLLAGGTPAPAPVGMPERSQVDLGKRQSSASYHGTTRTLNLVPEVMGGPELPAWVEGALLNALEEPAA